MNTLERIIKYTIYVLVFLVPLFFLPLSFEAFEYNKQYLLLFLVSIGFFAWLAKMVIVDKEIRFKRSPLDIFVLAFLLAAILSAAFSVDKTSSLYGFYGRFSNGLITLLSLGVLYFLITNNVTIENSKSSTVFTQQIPIAKILKIFLWSVGVIISLTYLAIFGILAKLSTFLLLPRVMTLSIFNPTSASLEGLSIFLAVVAVFLVGRMLTVEKSTKLLSVSNYLFLASILLLLVIIDFTAAWLVMLVALTLFVGLSLWKRMFKANVNRLLIPILLIVIAAACIPFNSQGTIANVPREQVLPQSISWQVGIGGALDSVKNIFLGSGIGTFHYDFAKEKPIEINESWLWQIRFDRAGVHSAEILGTMGLLGILSYLTLIGLFLVISYFFLQEKVHALPLLMVFVALVVSQFVYYQNSTLAFLFWLVLGLSAVAWQKPLKEKVVSFKSFPELNLIFSTIVIILGVGFLSMYFFSAKFYLADMNYAKAQIMARGEERTAKIEQAVRLNPRLSQYRAILARDYMQEALIEMQEPPENQDTAKIQTMVAIAIEQARIATTLAPNQVATWETLGMVYREIRQVASGATEWGIKSFEEAITLEPTNPVINTELGKLYLTTNEIDKAREQFARALEKKPDYIDALIQETLLLEREGDLNGAISKTENLAKNYPFSTEILFQLGRLYFNNNQIEEAVIQFSRVVILAPNHSNALYSLGVAYVAQGERSLAIQVFEKVLELNPGNQDVQDKLKQLR